MNDKFANLHPDGGTSQPTLPHGVKIDRISNGHGRLYWRVRLGKRFTGGKTMTRYFQDESEARAWVHDAGSGAAQEHLPLPSLRKIKADFGANGFTLTPPQLRSAIASQQLLAESDGGTDLYGAAEFYVRLEKRLRDPFEKSALRLPSERKLAKTLNLPVQTVRRSFERWGEELVRRDAHFPESRGGLKRVAVLNDLDLAKVNQPVAYLTRLQEAKQLLEASGRQVGLYLGDWVRKAEPPKELSCRQFLKDAEMGLISAVLAIWAYPDEQWMRSLTDAGVPIVGMGELYENTVAYDVPAALRASIALLKERGRQRIAYLGGVSQWNIDGYDRERINAIKSLLNEAGLPVENRWIRQDWHPTLHGGAWSSFREIWTAKSERPDALIVGAPSLWPGAKEALESLGIRYPDHLDVVTFQEGTNPLRDAEGTVEYVFDSSRSTRAAVTLLNELMDGKTPSERRLYIDGWQRKSPLPPLPATSGRSHRV